MRPTLLRVVLLMGAVACGHDPFGPETIMGVYGLRTISGERPPVLIPPEAPPFRYQVLGGNLALDTDRTFTLSLIVRVTEYTEDGSRIVGIRSEGPEIEVGTWSVTLKQGNKVWVDLDFSAHRRFGLEQTVTISDYVLKLQYPGDPEYLFVCGCGRLTTFDQDGSDDPR